MIFANTNPELYTQIIENMVDLPIGRTNSYLDSYITIDENGNDIKKTYAFFYLKDKSVISNKFKQENLEIKLKTISLKKVCYISIMFRFNEQYLYYLNLDPCIDKAAEGILKSLENQQRSLMIYILNHKSRITRSIEIDIDPKYKKQISKYFKHLENYNKWNEEDANISTVEYIDKLKVNSEKKVMEYLWSIAD